MRCIVLLACSACWTSTATPVAPPPRPTNVAHVDIATTGYAGPSPRAHRRFPRHSVWEGTYVCSQGLSYVKLTLDAEPSGMLRARYDFGPVPSNPTVPSGAYTMAGGIRTTEGGFTADLEPQDWIDHPGGYVAVALSLVAEGREMKGTIHHTSCSDLVTRRIE